MFSRAGTDDVSNIHRRWSFTTLGPSSFRTSFSGSLVCGAVLVAASHLYYFPSDALALFLPFSLGVLAALHFADYLALRGTPVNKLSKVAHVSLFANILWMLTALLGIAADMVLSKSDQVDLDYLVAGMLLAAGLRVGIFKSVFGAGLARAIPVSFLQPVVFFVAFIPISAFGAMSASYTGFAFGTTLFALGVIWTVVADKAGRPVVWSTFGLLQAFIAAWTENDPGKIEEFTESRAREENVETMIIRFITAGKKQTTASIVLPDVHPGPFGSVGGSNLPHVLYQWFANRALVMHSVSDHSLNIPSRREVEKYVSGLGALRSVQNGQTCSIPIQVKVGKSTSTGIAFGDNALVMLSLAPWGMEDVPQSVRTELESHGHSLGFSSVLVVDCHNAMGTHLSDTDSNDIAESGKRCLEDLKRQPQHGFMIGFASLDESGADAALASELGRAGIAVLAINVDGHSYAIGWADSNNMENKLRDYIVSKVSNGPTVLEICTSDTHSTSGKRTQQGYYPLGTISSAEAVASAFETVSSRAADRLESSSFELSHAVSKIKVMGRQQFGDYSSALDRSMRITKIFLGVTTIVYVSMLILS